MNSRPEWRWIGTLFVQRSIQIHENAPRPANPFLVHEEHNWGVCVCVDVTDIVNLNLLIPVRLVVVTRPPCSAPTLKNRAPVDKAQAPEETR